MHAILIATAALVGLPILLHLIMKQEPKRLPFPALRFLLLKRKTNQRKMKLRHFLLLALRMLLILLFGLAVFQPVLPSTGLDFGITLGSEQPVAAVIILDTSPSMGYNQNDVTRLLEARRRALELLDDLPTNSRVAILDPAVPGATWEASVSDARRRLEAMKEPRGVAVPVTTALAAAYQLLKAVDREAEAAEPLPRLVAIFSDRTTACWDASRSEDMIKIRDLVPLPAVAHLFVDVGLDQPADVAISALDFKPQVIPRGQPRVLNATVSTSGPGVEATVRCRVTAAKADAPAVPEEAKPIIIAANSSQGVSFTIPADRLQPGLYQVEILLETPDALLFDNVRYGTFKVAEPRKILAISNDAENARYWAAAHEVMGEFDCDILKPADVTDLAKYEAVALLSLTDPTKLWPKLTEYVEAGGKLLILPGGEGQVLPSAYAAPKLLPGSLTEVIDTERLDAKFKYGFAWRLDDDALRQQFLAPFRDWKLRGNIDIILQPRKAWKFWGVNKAPEASVIVEYDSEDFGKSYPAMLERIVGGKGGKVLLVTTRLDTPPDDLTQKWNNYWDADNSWRTVFPNLLLRYVAGDPSDAVLNFTTGQPLPLPMPRGGAAKLRLEGPGVTARDAELDAKADARLPVSRTSLAGSYRVFTPNKDWLDGFSLNPPSEECSLAKVPVEAIETLCGPGSVVPAEKKLSLRDLLKLKYDQPVELFPWLLLAVLLLLVLEAYIANRFYGRKS